MRNLILFMALILILGVHGLQAQGAKIGIVHIDAVVQKSIKGKAFIDEHQGFREEKRDEINKLYQNYEQKDKEFQAKSPSLNEERRREFTFQLERLRLEIRRKQEQSENELSNRLNEGMMQIREELDPLIEKIGSEKDFDLILRYDPDSNMLYVNDKIDITNEVIKRYDDMMK